jgi:peptide/nickel transport system substrate-binding protein
MARGMTRREFAISAGAASFAGFGLSARARAADRKTLRFIPQSDLHVLDPIWTTAYVTRNHGYMVFDTLFALDSKFKPHPQMVGDFIISADKLVYSFALRDGSNFTTGSRCAAPIASHRSNGGWRAMRSARRSPPSSTR